MEYTPKTLLQRRIVPKALLPHVISAVQKAGVQNLDLPYYFWIRLSQDIPEVFVDPDPKLRGKPLRVVPRMRVKFSGVSYLVGWSKRASVGVVWPAKSLSLVEET